LWAALGFIVGCVLTAVAMWAILAPPPALAAQTSPPQVVVLRMTVTDTLLTQSLDADAGLAPVPVSQLRAHIQADGDVVVSGAMQAIPSGPETSFVFDMQPYVSHHTMLVRIVRASVGGNAVPPSAFDALRDKVNQQLAPSSRLSLGAGQPLVATAMNFADGALTVSYTFAGA
jgi:hypothetical protein